MSSAILRIPASEIEQTRATDQNVFVKTKAGPCATIPRSDIVSWDEGEDFVYAATYWRTTDRVAVAVQDDRRVVPAYLISKVHRFPDGTPDYLELVNRELILGLDKDAYVRSDGSVEIWNSAQCGVDEEIFLDNSYPANPAKETASERVRRWEAEGYVGYDVHSSQNVDAWLAGYGKKAKDILVYYHMDGLGHTIYVATREGKACYQPLYALSFVGLTAYSHVTASTGTETETAGERLARWAGEGTRCTYETFFADDIEELSDGSFVLHGKRYSAHDVIFTDEPGSGMIAMYTPSEDEYGVSPNSVPAWARVVLYSKENLERLTKMSEVDSLDPAVTNNQEEITMEDQNTNANERPGMKAAIGGANSRALDRVAEAGYGRVVSQVSNRSLLRVAKTLPEDSPLRMILEDDTYRQGVLFVLAYAGTVAGEAGMPKVSNPRVQRATDKLMENTAGAALEGPIGMLFDLVGEFIDDLAAVEFPEELAAEIPLADEVAVAETAAQVGVGVEG